MTALDIIVPVFNEKIEVVLNLVARLKSDLGSWDDATIIVVDDGSERKFNLCRLSDEAGIRFVCHPTNQGYGEALKTGIRAGSAPWIAIIDADDTYPVDELKNLIKQMDHADMVVGARTGDIRKIPWLRRFPKYMLNRLASYMAGKKILDLNSGMRIFSRELCYQLWPFFPKGFSFTSTLTMGALLGGLQVKEEQINYYKRAGNSSIRPVKDTFQFIHIILRMGILFHPMKLFIPIAIFLASIGFIKGFLRDLFVVGYIGNLSIMLMLAGLQIFLMGYIAELIVINRLWGYKKKRNRP